MKKRLFSIIAILGIGVSFCSANDFSIYDYYSNLNTQDNNGRKFGHILQFAVSGSSVYIDTFCFSGHWFYGSTANICSDTKGGGVVVYNFDGQTNTPVSVSSNSYCTVSTHPRTTCVDFSGLLLEPGQTMYYTLYSYNDNRTNTNYVLGGGDGYPYNTSSTAVYRPVNFNGTAQYGYFYQPVQDGLSFLIEIVNYGGASYVGPGLIKYHYTNPEFKVNYGDTSYTYTLEDNLSIYLKSPVVQSGNTFSYVGSTGLNLFYNGLTQFYSKSNLYLDSNYRYNNNIFTPICN